MKYTILQLATLAGISTRTLRYYDEINLLKPVRDPNSGYRLYGNRETDILWQILFYKEIGFELSAIKTMITNPDFNLAKALKQHLTTLEAKERDIRLLIETVKKTIQKEEGIIIMTDTEKFEAFKKSVLSENNAQYGEELQTAYGTSVIEDSNQQFMNLSEEEYNKMKQLEQDIRNALEKAVTKSCDPHSLDGAHIASMHKEWLSFTWPSYSPEAHRNLSIMYVKDERFQNYYDQTVEGCAKFLHDAIHFHIR